MFYYISFVIHIFIVRLLDSVIEFEIKAMKCPKKSEIENSKECEMPEKSIKISKIHKYIVFLL